MKARLFIVLNLILFAGAPWAFGISVADGIQWADGLSLADWMGPLAPVALSPFFGLMCLSGASLLMEQGWLPPHPLLQHHALLANEIMFGVLLALTAMTSLPRLSKVSKPITQFADYLETYAAVVLLLAIYYVHGGEPDMAETPPGIVIAGFTETAGFVFIAVVAGINVVVIQTVRLFFEMLVWISPIPLLDAVFEVFNKTVCLALTAVYVFHPAAALAVNLVLFFLCLLVVRRVHRRLASFRNHVLKPLIKRGFRKERREVHGAPGGT
ncbi:MAG TPA: hypothetical protein PKE26_13220 [Kiritimatiellia bacterium]|nr:hypothetical protein [Kiritimatiellia bacterium]HMP00063.1 hypothetical protein [Kiritimatiellia bacterium]HMP96532.1 hypothetical protein [Kiritimatiellia bacterium]